MNRPPVPKETEFRYAYPFNENSFVLDLGFYEGDFALEMWHRYKCRIWSFEPVPDFYVAGREAIKGTGIELFPCGVVDIAGIHPIGIKGNMSGRDSETEHRILAPFLALSRVLRTSPGYDNVDLLKLNVEGDEFPLLEYLIEENGWFRRIRNIQVQFHRHVEDAAKRRKAIRQALLDAYGYELTYYDPWTWELYRLRA